MLACDSVFTRDFQLFDSVPVSELADGSAALAPPLQQRLRESERNTKVARSVAFERSCSRTRAALEHSLALPASC
jgi:hypothetical protein